MVHNLVAERIAIDSYREMVAYFGEDDPTSRRVMEEILAKARRCDYPLPRTVNTDVPRALQAVCA